MTEERRQGTTQVSDKGVVRKERVERRNSAIERTIREKNTLQDRIKQADLVK